MKRNRANASTPKTLVDCYGISGVGKTSTLKELINILQASPTYTCIHAQPFSPYDLWIICKYKGKTVGVITQGDPGCEDNVKDFLDACKAEDCDIIFTASRTRGEIFGMVINFANTNGYSFIETSPLFMRNPNGYNGNFGSLHEKFADMLETLI